MCWLREKRNFCLWTVHTLMVLSSEAVTRVCPSPEKLTLRTEAVWALKNVDSAFLYTYTNTKTTHKIKTNCKNLWVLKCVSSSVLAGAQKTQCNCLVVLFFFYQSASFSFVLAFKRNIIILIMIKMLKVLYFCTTKQRCDSHAGHPKTYSLVSGGGGHQVARGRKLNWKDSIFVSIKTICSHLRFHVPDHHTGVHRACGWDRREHRWENWTHCIWPQKTYHTENTII